MKCLTVNCNNEMHRRGYCIECWSKGNGSATGPAKPIQAHVPVTKEITKQKAFINKGRY